MEVSLPPPQITDDHISPILMYLIKYEKQGHTLGHIDDSGLFQCDMEKVPIHWIALSPVEHQVFDGSRFIYVIPNDGGNGDILHSIKIQGRFQSATLYQNSFIDGRIVYESMEGTNLDHDSVTFIKPFPYSGIPLEQIKKHIYLELIPENDQDCPPQTWIGYGFLDVPIRKQLEHPRFYHFKGVSILHQSGARYAIFGTNVLGQTVNILGPEG